MKIDSRWVEGSADPFEPLSVLLLVGIGDGVEELAIAPGPANILRRAAPARPNRAGLNHAWHSIGYALTADGGHCQDNPD